MDELDKEVLDEERMVKEKERLKERGGGSSSTQVEREREKVRKEVFERQLEKGKKHIRKQQAKFWQKQKRERGIFKVGDKVVVNNSLKKSFKKAGLGKGYYPYSGEIVEVLAEGKYYKIKWGMSHPARAKEGQVAKKRFRIDQVLRIKEGEQVELVLQHYLQADSYNTEMLKDKLPKLEEILRQRRDEKSGDLEVLCVWKDKWNPSWEWVRDVGSTKQYKEFREHLDYYEEMRSQRREEEEEVGRFEVERIFYQIGDEVLVLWANFNEPSRVSIQQIKHLEVYKEWKRTSRVFLEESELESEEDKEEEESSEVEFSSEGESIEAEMEGESSEEEEEEEAEDSEGKAEVEWDSEEKEEEADSGEL